jgi:hypothetical protein
VKLVSAGLGFVVTPEKYNAAEGGIKKAISLHPLLTTDRDVKRNWDNYQLACQHAATFLKNLMYPPHTDSLGNYHPTKGAKFHTYRYEALKGNLKTHPKTCS